MARPSLAKQVEQQNEEHALGFFEAALSMLPDPRRRQGIRYPLRSVVVIALMASVCGCDDAEAMEAWGEANAEWLAGFLELPHGAPSQDVFLSVFAALDPAKFSAVFRAFASFLKARLGGKGSHIAIDGKTSRGSASPATSGLAVHTVSAWLTDAGLVLGQCKTKEKSNEIKAIPELLSALDLRGATVTIDAMGCQTEIAKTIVEGGGNYLLPVKDNQPTLHYEAMETFAEATKAPSLNVDETRPPIVKAYEEVEKGHGRLERREVLLCHDLRWLTTTQRWSELAFIAKVTRERTDTTTGKHSNETSYYIGSDASLDAESVARLIRRHWSIENELHWVLDVAFREDDARHRAKNTAQNMSILRHFALNILKQDRARKLGIANSRKRAGWDRNYLLSLLTGHDP